MNKTKEIGWALYRWYRRLGEKVTRRLMRHFNVYQNISGTDVPNVPFLRVISMTMVNGYGQTREWPRKPEKKAA